MVKEDVRATWSLIWLERFAQDVKYGARLLRKNPGFTLIAVLTLALGIGANTAIFSAIDALMLRPLPFTAADQLVRINSTTDGVPITGFAYPGGPSLLDMRDFAQNSHSFQKMAVYDTWRKNVSFTDAEAEPEQMQVGLVSAAYFEVLDIQPIMGRLFTEEENQEGKDYVAAISARLWKRRFAGDPAILGRKIVINAEPYTIVAVMPDVIPEWMEPGHLGAIEVWTPFPASDVLPESSRGARGFGSLARINPGVKLEQAQAELSTIAAAMAAAHPADHGVGVSLSRVAGRTRGNNAASVIPADGSRQPDLAHCLRELGEFAFGAQFGTATGTGRTRGAGRRPRRANPSVARRNAAAIADRRRGWCGAGTARPRGPCEAAP